MPVSVNAGKTPMATKGMTSKEAGRYDPVRGKEEFYSLVSRFGFGLRSSSVTMPVSKIAGKTPMATKGMTSKEAGRYDPMRGTEEEYCSLVSRFGLISGVHPQLR
jgi:hypothetical protein